MMQEEMEARVWQRVLQMPQTQPEEDMLKAWIADTLAAQRSYQTMSRRSGGQKYRAMAEAEAAQVRELSALLFLLYGTRGRIFGGAAEGKRVMTASVRSRYAAEAAAEKAFFEAANRWPEHAELFRKMAARAAHHRKMLWKDAQRFSNWKR